MERDKKQSTSKIIIDSEGRETYPIYITENDYLRLDGDGSFGPWDKRTRYSNTPSERYCYQTFAPESALEDGMFNPAYTNPDEIVELCQKVSDKEIKRAQKETAYEKPKELVFKKGQTVWIALHGAGVTSYEEVIVESVRKGKVKIKGSDTICDAKTGKNLSDMFPGFSMDLLTQKPEDFEEGGHNY